MWIIRCIVLINIFIAVLVARHHIERDLTDELRILTNNRHFGFVVHKVPKALKHIEAFSEKHRLLFFVERILVTLNRCHLVLLKDSVSITHHLKFIEELVNGPIREGACLEVLHGYKYFVVLILTSHHVIVKVSSELFFEHNVLTHFLGNRVSLMHRRSDVLNLLLCQLTLICLLNFCLILLFLLSNYLLMPRLLSCHLLSERLKLDLLALRLLFEFLSL